MSDIQHTIETMAWTIFGPCQNLAIKHQVTFGKKDMSNHTRKSEIFEYGYTSDKYMDTPHLCSMFVSTSDFIILENNMLNKDEGHKVLFTDITLSKLKFALMEVKKWFDEHDDLFYIDESKDNKVIFNDHDYKDLEAIVVGVADTYLTIKPAAIERKSGMDIEEGIFIFFNNNIDKPIKLSFDELYAIIDFFSTFNIALSNQGIQNYVMNLKETQIVEKIISYNNSSGSSRRPGKVNKVRNKNRKRNTSKEVKSGGNKKEKEEK